MNNTSYANIRAIRRRTVFDSGCSRTGMYDGSVTDVQGHMPRITDDVTRLSIRQRIDGHAGTSLGHIGPSEGISEIGIYQ